MLRMIVVLTLFFFSSNVFAWDASRNEAGENDISWKKPVLYSLSMMAVGYAGLVLSGEIDKPGVDHFQEAYESGPEWDGDEDIYNFIWHPLWGSETYLRAREGNFGVWASLAFSTGCSVFWEYLVESWSQHPSQQDILFTSGLGFIIGEIRYRLKQKMDKDRNWIVDPIHATLEHMNIIVTEDAPGENKAYVALDWDF